MYENICNMYFNIICDNRSFPAHTRNVNYSNVNVALSYIAEIKGKCVVSNVMTTFVFVALYFHLLIIPLLYVWKFGSNMCNLAPSLYQSISNKPILSVIKYP